MGLYCSLVCRTFGWVCTVVWSGLARPLRKEVGVSCYTILTEVQYTYCQHSYCMVVWMDEITASIPNLKGHLSEKWHLYMGFLQWLDFSHVFGQTTTRFSALIKRSGFY